MEYQNVDEGARRESCERLKMIVQSIKALKIKYYLNFSRMSSQDQETYLRLQNDLDRVAEESDLNNLKVELMADLSARYDGVSSRQGDSFKNGDAHNNDDLLKACYGAIDAQAESISKGRIAQAIRCQEQLKRYKQGLDSDICNEVTRYKREKFAELGCSREVLEEKNKTWKNKMKGMYKIKHVEQRSCAVNQISGTPKRAPEVEEKIIGN